MSKGKKRQSAQAAKAVRRSKMKEAGGKSKYAAKRLRNARGNFAPTSPFYVAPER